MHGGRINLSVSRYDLIPKLGRGAYCNLACKSWLCLSEATWPRVHKLVRNLQSCSRCWRSRFCRKQGIVSVVVTSLQRRLLRFLSLGVEGLLIDLLTAPSEHPEVFPRLLDAGVDGSQLVSGSLLEFRAHVIHVVDVQHGGNTLQRSTEIRTCCKQAVLVIDSLILNGYSKVASNILQQGVGKVRRPHEVAHFLDVEPVVQRAVDLNPKNPRGLTWSASHAPW